MRAAGSPDLRVLAHLRVTNHYGVAAREPRLTMPAARSGPRAICCRLAEIITSGADTAYLRISDLTAGWNACWTGDPGTDSVTCDISSWTDREITFGGYTGGYGQGNWVVTEGDEIEVQVWNPQSGKGPAICQVVAGSGVPAHCSGR